MSLHPTELPAVEIQKPNVWWKSKGFWGNVISSASIFVPPPFVPIVNIAGNALGLWGRATAKGPLTLTQAPPPANPEPPIENNAIHSAQTSIEPEPDGGTQQ